MNYGGIFENQYFLYEKMTDFLPHREHPATPCPYTFMNWPKMLQNGKSVYSVRILIPSVSYPFLRNVMWQRYIYDSQT